jgi:Fic family protein
MAEFNLDVLRDLELDPGVVPGRIRTDSVVVGNAYRGAPAEDCELLLEKLCAWLNGPEFVAGENDPYGFTKILMKAVLAHLYVAWIHPFGDGNGRTARLIEFQVLVESGVPLPAAHLLSDHYNLTRERYYRVLARTSRPPYPITDFAEYALTGLVDELRSQLDLIRMSQLDVTWENYVHDQFRYQETPARRRQKHLALDLRPNDWTPRSELRRVSGRISEEYAGKGTKTITRDINALCEMGLIHVSRQGVKPNRGLVLAFLPVRADGPVAAVDVVLPDGTTAQR